MKNNRIASALRALTAAPSLESETGEIEQVAVAADDVPATGVVVDVDKGPEGVESAETTVEDSEVAAAGTAEVSQESDDASSVVTGDGEVTVVAEVPPAQTTQADVEGEDKPGTGKVVTVDEGPKDIESAETVSTDSDVSVSQEGAAGAIVGGVFAMFTFGLVLPTIPMAVLGAVAGHLAQKYTEQRRSLEQLAQEGKKAVRDGNDDEVKKLAEKFQKQQIELARLQGQIEAEAKQKKVSNESHEDGAAAAAAFAAGAAGAAEAAAQATEASDAAEAPAGEAAPAVVEEAAAEIAEAQAEAAEQVAEVVETEVVETPEEIAEAEEISAGEDEMAELEADIAEGEAHAEKYEQGAAALESLVDAIAQAQQSGGLNPQSAQFLNIGFESVGVFLTGKPFTNARGEAPIPSMESFGGTMRRDQATSVSMESVQDWLKKVWEVLKQTFKTIKDWVVKFFQAVFSQCERYKQRAAKIKAAAGKLRSGAQPKNASFELAQSVANKIHMNGEVSRWDMHDLVQLAEVAATRNSEGSRALIQLRQQIKEIVDVLIKGSYEGEVEKAKLEEIMFGKLGISDTMSSGVLRNAAFSVATEHEGLKGYKTKSLPGGVELMVVEPDSEQKLHHALRGWRVLEIKSQTEVKSTVQTLSGQQIQKIAGDAEKVLGLVSQAKAEFKAESLDLVDISFASADLSKAQATFLQKVGNLYARAVQSQSSGTSKILKYLVSTSGAFLDFGAASLKQYGAEVQDEAPAAAAA